VAPAAGAIQPEQVDDLSACLQGIFTLMRLHFVQEEERNPAVAKTTSQVWVRSGIR
jgi:hypothetical protein